MIFFILVTLLVVVLSWFGTGQIRNYALKHNVIDIPNDRSSHLVPTPRGGGMAIIGSVFVGLLLTMVQSPELWLHCTVLLMSTAAVATIGFMDDHGHVNSLGRLSVHFAASIAIVVFAQGLPELTIFTLAFDLDWAGGVLAVVAIVWLLNLNNFMDGIDGIASAQSLLIALGMLVCIYITGQNTVLAWWWAILAAAVCGFLYWNFPPAKIFMGDAGSGGLGFLVGALLLFSAKHNAELLWSGLILFGVFIVDATYTLMVRLCTGHKVYEPHRTHAYQKLSRRWQGHKPVTLSLIVFNVLWLVPWALLVSAKYIDGAVALVVSYLPLIYFARLLRAGHDD